MVFKIRKSSLLFLIASLILVIGLASLKTARVSADYCTGWCGPSGPGIGGGDDEPSGPGIGGGETGQCACPPCCTGTSGQCSRQAWADLDSDGCWDKEGNCGDPENYNEQAVCHSSYYPNCGDGCSFQVDTAYNTQCVSGAYPGWHIENCIGGCADCEGLKFFEVSTANWGFSPVRFPSAGNMETWSRSPAYSPYPEYIKRDDLRFPPDGPVASELCLEVVQRYKVYVAKTGSHFLTENNGTIGVNYCGDNPNNCSCANGRDDWPAGGAPPALDYLLDGSSWSDNCLETSTGASVYKSGTSDFREIYFNNTGWYSLAFWSGPTASDCTSEPGGLHRPGFFIGHFFYNTDGYRFKKLPVRTRYDEAEDWGTLYVVLYNDMDESGVWDGVETDELDTDVGYITLQKSDGGEIPPMGVVSDEQGDYYAFPMSGSLEDPGYAGSYKVRFTPTGDWDKKNWSYAMSGTSQTPALEFTKQGLHYYTTFLGVPSEYFGWKAFYIGAIATKDIEGYVWDTKGQTPENSDCGCNNGALSCTANAAKLTGTPSQEISGFTDPPTSKNVVPDTAKFSKVGETSGSLRLSWSGTNQAADYQFLGACKKNSWVSAGDINLQIPGDDHNEDGVIRVDFAVAPGFSNVSGKVYNSKGKSISNSNCSNGVFSLAGAEQLGSNGSIDGLAVSVVGGEFSKTNQPGGNYTISWTGSDYDFVGVCRGDDLVEGTGSTNLSVPGDDAYDNEPNNGTIRTDVVVKQNFADVEGWVYDVGKTAFSQAAHCDKGRLKTESISGEEKVDAGVIKGLGGDIVVGSDGQTGHFKKEDLSGTYSGVVWDAAGDSYVIAGHCYPGIAGQIDVPDDDYSDDDPYNGTIRFDVAVTEVKDPWFQVKGGDIHANGGGISSSIPDWCIGSCQPYLMLNSSLSGHGVAETVTSLDLGDEVPFSPESQTSGHISEDDNDWRAESVGGYEGNDYDYDFWYSHLSAELESWNGAAYPGSGLWQTTGGGKLTIGGWDVGSGDKVVILHDGDEVEINNDIEVAEGGSLVVITKGTVDIDPTVEELHGYYIADKTIYTGNDSDGDVQLTVEGGLISWERVDLERDLAGADNNTMPAEVFVFRPDILSNLHEELKVKEIQKWQEVAP